MSKFYPSLETASAVCPPPDAFMANIFTNKNLSWSHVKERSGEVGDFIKSNGTHLKKIIVKMCMQTLTLPFGFVWKPEAIETGRQFVSVNVWSETDLDSCECLSLPF